MTARINATVTPEGRAPRLAAGRFCPVDYRYDPSVFRRAPDIVAPALVVAGGLYGNGQALDALEARVKAERHLALVLNGDAHWFDATPDWFGRMEARLAAYPALRGNVETEIARAGDIGAGCGCAYPPDVDSGVVERSNIILARLRDMAGHLPGAATRMGALPMHLVAQVGDARIGIVHGDAWSLAGWDFAHDALDATTDERMRLLQETTGIDVFASTHTCLPALRRFDDGRLTIINNGAAGMPNFTGTRFGLATRIGLTPAPDALYGVTVKGVHVEAVPVAYDAAAFDADFATAWPEGSPAHASYAGRIAKGPTFTLAQAMPH
jgi:hypothetical protein